VRRQTQQGTSDPTPTGTVNADGTVTTSEANDVGPTDNAAQAGLNVAMFNAELYRRAVTREAELLDKLRALKVEVMLLNEFANDIL